ALGGTSTVSDVAVRSFTSATMPLNRTTLSVTVPANPEPVSTTRSPGSPDCGSALETAGPEGATVKDSVASAVLPPTDTVTFPLTASDGTVTTRRVGEAELTVALFPPTVTVWAEGVEEKPVPEMVIFAPGAARTGTTESTDGVLEGYRSMPSRFPASSYR